MDFLAETGITPILPRISICFLRDNKRLCVASTKKATATFVSVVSFLFNTGIEPVRAFCVKKTALSAVFSKKVRELYGRTVDMRSRSRFPYESPYEETVD